MWKMHRVNKLPRLWQQPTSTSLVHSRAITEPAATPETDTPEKATHTEFYFSPDSKLVRIFSWLLSLKAGGAGLASGVLFQREGAKLYDLYMAAEESMLPFQTFVDTTTLPLPVRSRESLRFVDK